MYFRLRVNSAKRSNASISSCHDEYKNFLCCYCGTVTISFRKCLGAKTNAAAVRQESLQASLFSPLQSLYLKRYLLLVSKTHFGQDQILVIQYTLFALHSPGIAIAKLTVKKKNSLERVAANYYSKLKRDYALKNQYFRSHFLTLMSHME